MIHFPAERRLTLIQSHAFEAFINNSLEVDLFCSCLYRDRVKENHSHWMLFQLSQFLNTIWPPSKGGAIFIVLSGSSKGHMLPTGRRARGWTWPQHRLCPHCWGTVTQGTNRQVEPGIGNKVHPQHHTWQSDGLGLGSVQGVQSGAKGDEARDRTGNKATTWVWSSSRSQDQRQGMDTTYNVWYKGSLQETRYLQHYAAHQQQRLQKHQHWSHGKPDHGARNRTSNQKTRSANAISAARYSRPPDTNRNGNTAAIHNNYEFSVTLVHFTHLMAMKKPLSSPLSSCIATGEGNTCTKRMLP